MDSQETPQYDRTPYYCEENVYRLCKKLYSAENAETENSDFFVVFISNDKKQIPLWHQKASHRADGIILWDYHVICVQRKENEKSLQVWDLDSTLPFPTPLTTYVAETFRPSFPLFSEYRRFYRIVHAPMFLRCFASDRRHMKDPEGNWNAQPPAYDPIVAEGSMILMWAITSLLHQNSPHDQPCYQDGAVHNLNEYMEIRSTDVVPAVEADLVNAVKNQRLGLVVSESQLEEFFALPT